MLAFDRSTRRLSDRRLRSPHAVLHALRDLAWISRQRSRISSGVGSGFCGCPVFATFCLSLLRWSLDRKNSAESLFATLLIHWGPWELNPHSLLIRVRCPDDSGIRCTGGLAQPHAGFPVHLRILIRCLLPRPFVLSHRLFAQPHFLTVHVNVQRRHVAATTTYAAIP